MECDAATLRRLLNIAPRDVIDAMLRAQMVASTKMPWSFRRAAASGQTFAGRELGLKYGERLVRSFAALTDALNRHRGKGQQVVRVEHVTVQAGGQAIVGAVTQGRGGGHKESEDGPHALAHTPEPEMRRAGRAAGTRAGRRQCQVSDAAGCMAAPGAAEHRPVTATP